MSKKEEGNIFKFLLGLLCGTISGVVLGLLFAPKTGKEFRDDVTAKSKELRNEVASKSKEFKNYTKDKLSEIQETGKEKAIKVANTIQEKASKITSNFDKLSKSGSEVLIQDEIQ